MEHLFDIVTERIYLNWRKFCWFKNIFFNINKSISSDQREFFWINKTFFNSKKFFLWLYIKEMFLWFKEIVFGVYNLCTFLYQQTLHLNLSIEIAMYKMCNVLVTHLLLL